MGEGERGEGKRRGLEEREVKRWGRREGTEWREGWRRRRDGAKERKRQEGMKEKL